MLHPHQVPAAEKEKMVESEKKPFATPVKPEEALNPEPTTGRLNYQAARNFRKRFEEGQ